MKKKTHTPKRTATTPSRVNVFLSLRSCLLHFVCLLPFFSLSGTRCGFDAVRMFVAMFHLSYLTSRKVFNSRTWVACIHLVGLWLERTPSLLFHSKHKRERKKNCTCVWIEHANVSNFSHFYGHKFYFFFFLFSFRYLWTHYCCWFIHFSPINMKNNKPKINRKRKKKDDDNDDDKEDGKKYILIKSIFHTE